MGHLLLNHPLQRVLDQTYTYWELIVIGKHSIDNADQVMESFFSPSITYLKIHNKSVIAACRNVAIWVTKGNSITLLDSDDFWSGDMLQVTFNHISDKVYLIYNDMEIVTKEIRPFREKIIKSRQLKTVVLKNLLINSNTIVNYLVFILKSLLEKISSINKNEEIVVAEDHNILLRIAKQTSQFSCLSYKLVYYLIHNQSISKKTCQFRVVMLLMNFYIYLISKINKLKMDIRYI